ncbi:MAG TPA: hypothetical protein ENM98_02215 [Halothiobacillaceae bacterium]|nr:hypothetical protein [Halothiobacillaceae bacterium]
MAVANQCTLYIPGLCLGSSEPEWQAKSGLLADYLQYGRKKTVQNAELTDSDFADDPQARVLSALGVEQPEAFLHAVNYAGGVQPDDLTWMACFEPVHLKAETDHAIVLGRRYLQITAAEQADILDVINPFLQADGLTVWQRDGQVYLGGRKNAAFDLSTASLTPLAHALNRNAGAFIHPGRGDAHWQRLQTELQMLLYSHPVNQQRAAHGQPEINSFWPHAAVSLPVEPSVVPGLGDKIVLTDSPLLRQVIAGAQDLEHAGKALNSGQGQDVLILATEPGWCRLEGDVAGYHAALNRLDELLAELDMPNLVISDTQGTYWRRATPWQRLYQRLVRRHKR